MLKSTERKIRKIVGELLGRKYYGGRVAMPYYASGGGGGYEPDDKTIGLNEKNQLEVIDYISQDSVIELLTYYYTSDAVDTLLFNKQNTTDNNLQTTAKTVVGAINELNALIGEIDAILERLTVGTGAVKYGNKR